MTVETTSKRLDAVAEALGQDPDALAALWRLMRTCKDRKEAVEKWGISASHDVSVISAAQRFFDAIWDEKT